MSNDQKTSWQPIDTAPRDGTPFWAYLFQTGIRKLRFMPAQEAADRDGGEANEYDDAFAECWDAGETWEPKFWLPLSALPEDPTR